MIATASIFSEAWGKRVQVGKLGCKRLSRNYKYLVFLKKIKNSLPTSRLGKLIPYFHTDVSEIVPERSLHVGICCFFLQRFPTKIGCKLTDKIRLLNLMLVRKQIGAWRFSVWFLLLSIPWLRFPGMAQTSGAPRASDIAFSDGATEPRFNGVVTGWDESQGYGRASQLFFSTVRYIPL